MGRDAAFSCPLRPDPPLILAEETIKFCKSTMARSDLILNLVRSARTGDRRSLERSVEAMIVEEKARQHGVFAKRLEDELRMPCSPLTGALPIQTNGSSVNYWHEREPQRELASLELPARLSKALVEILEEQRRADLLRCGQRVLVGPRAAR